MTAAFAVALFAGAASAQSVVEWDVFGTPGTQVTQPATFSAANISGDDVTRFGNNPSAGGNSISGNNWSVGSYFAFGFSIDAGYQADLDTLFIGTRSSNTGPGFLGLYSSLDGFSSPLFNFVQPGADFMNHAIDLSGLGTLTGDIEFRVVVENNVSANGGTLASTGAFRITNYFVDGSFAENFGITGAVSLIPTPGSAALIGLAGLAAVRRRR